MSKILISDSDSGHANQVKASILSATTYLVDADIEIRLNYTMQQDFQYAFDNNILFVVRSTTGISTFITEAQNFYPDVLGIIPAGANTPGEIFSLPIPQIVCVTGAGDTANETADNIEFFDNDPQTAETTDPDEQDLSSFSNGVIAGKLYEIIARRNCGHWEARWCTQQTASENGVWHETNGYGIINVTAAVLQSRAAMPRDPFVDAGKRTRLLLV